MKGQLTIQELSAYLPYKVMCLNQHLPDVEFVEEELIGIENHITWCGIFSARHGSNHVPISAIKPIIYSLSSLTKTIEHKGERFVPYDKLKTVVSEKQWVLICNTICDEYIKVVDMPYWWVRQVLSWHIDIFGLLDRGLAIDKTTIQ